VLVSDDPAVPVAYRSREAIDFYLQPIPDGIWENEVTVRSTRAARMYEPGAWIARVSPTSLLMVVAAEDRVTVSDVALGAYKRALEPKRLTLISGGHFDPYRFASWLYRMAPFLARRLPSGSTDIERFCRLALPHTQQSGAVLRSDQLCDAPPSTGGLRSSSCRFSTRF
jgi:hypothetical protein